MKTFISPEARKNVYSNLFPHAVDKTNHKAKFAREAVRLEGIKFRPTGLVPLPPGKTLIIEIDALNWIMFDGVCFYSTTFIGNRRDIKDCRPILVIEAAETLKKIDVLLPSDGLCDILAQASEKVYDNIDDSTIASYVYNGEQIYFRVNYRSGYAVSLETLDAIDGEILMRKARMQQKKIVHGTTSDFPAPDEKHIIRVTVPYILESVVRYFTHEFEKSIDLFSITPPAGAGTGTIRGQETVTSFLTMTAWAAWNNPDDDIEATYYGDDSDIFIGSSLEDYLFGGAWQDAIRPFQSKYYEFVSRFADLKAKSRAALLEPGPPKIPQLDNL